MYELPPDGYLRVRKTHADKSQLHLTPKESHRLRQVSFERQSKAGFKNPGRAGIVAEYPTFEAEQQMQPVKNDRQYSV